MASKKKGGGPPTGIQDQASISASLTPEDRAVLEALCPPDPGPAYEVVEDALLALLVKPAR